MEAADLHKSGKKRRYAKKRVSNVLFILFNYLKLNLRLMFIIHLFCFSFTIISALFLLMSILGKTSSIGILFN